MNPAAIYLRVSKDDGSQTTDNQRPDVEQMASGRGYTVAPEHLFIDEASGAKGADERPALAALLEAAARGRFRAVFVWRLDRLSRDDTFRGGLMMVGELDRFNVALLSHGEPWIDTAGPFRGALVQISLTLAAEERRVLIQRTKAGLERARRAGKQIGRERATLSDAALARGAELRRRGVGWFSVRDALASEALLLPFRRGKSAGKLPTAPVVYRALTKAFPDLLPGGPKKSRLRGRRR